MKRMFCPLPLVIVSRVLTLSSRGLDARTCAASSTYDDRLARLRATMQEFARFSGETHKLRKCDVRCHLLVASFVTSQLTPRSRMVR